MVQAELYLLVAVCIQLSKSRISVLMKFSSYLDENVGLTLIQRRTEKLLQATINLQHLINQ